MPTYRVTIAGRTYNVEVPNPNERPVRAIVDGEVVEVAVETPSGALPAAMPAPAVTSPIPAPAPPVAAPAPTAPVQPASTPAPAAGGVGGGESVVKAPLPGTVVNIGVSEGDRVEYGQELCTLEAMKMNNPIRATQAGTVIAIHVRIGEQVQHGAPLITLEG